jgi:hypothetical protein
MQLVAYASKLYALGMCLLASVPAMAIFLSASESRKWMSLPFAGLAVLMIIVCVVGILRGKPIVTADETGIRDSRVSKNTILWKDILAFRHAPRSEKLVNGHKSFSLFDGWRPIQLWVNPPETSLFTKLQTLSRPPVHADFPHAYYLLIDFCGLDMPSSHLTEYIRKYAPNAKEEIS